MNKEMENIRETDSGNDYFATEILGELKRENERKERENERKEHTIRTLIKVIVGIVVVAIFAIAGVTGGFLWYLNQYDFSSTSATYTDADGVYTLVDSEGNVISADLTPEELEMILNGYSEVGQSDDQTQD